MSKTIRKLTALLIAIAIAAGTMFAPQTFAATTTTFYNNVTTIPISRTITGVSNPVTNTFSYTVTANSSNPTGASGIPTSASISFSSATPSSSHTVSSSSTLDFSGATFTKAGDYYFTVEETGSTDSANFPIDTTTYTAIASVRYAVNSGVTDPNTLVVTLLQDMQKTGGGKEPAIWQSEAPRTYFEISAQTTGNIADVTHCFGYTLKIPTGNGVNSGDTFSISASSECTNPSTITAGQNATISLKNGDTIQVGGTQSTVSQLPVGSGYSITLNDAEGYTAEFNSNTMQAGVAQNVAGLVAVSSSDFNTKNKASIVLSKNADVPTGILNNTIIYIIILTIGAIGLAFTSKKLYSKK